MASEKPQFVAFRGIDGAIIRPRTAEARVTVKIFRMNDVDRVLERQRLIEASLFENLDHD